jgi:hypothetical protein
MNKFKQFGIKQLFVSLILIKNAFGQIKQAQLVEFRPDKAPDQVNANVQVPKQLMGYLIEPRVVAQTPKHLGVNMEIGYHHDQVNLWDWLVYSGASLVRLSDVDFRKSTVPIDRFKQIRNKEDFEAWRKQLLSDPLKNIPWQYYSFEEFVPWVGYTNGILGKMQKAKVGALAPIAYLPSRYPVSPLKSLTEQVPVPDNLINWDAAASAYEYSLAQIYHMTSRFGVTQYMMMNEPESEDKTAMQCGVIAQMIRLALEDMRVKLVDRQLATALSLGGPGHDIGSETWFKYIHPYVDIIDMHIYNPDSHPFARKYARLEMNAVQKNKKTAISEFNRIPGPTQPDQNLFSIRASLELADIIMTLLSCARPNALGFEYAMLYQFSFPSTHRSHKSLLYGDMNLMDWIGTDRVTYRMASELQNISKESMQMRHPTPAFHMFRMLNRCTPGSREKAQAYEVLATGETDRGSRPGYNAALDQSTFSRLEPKKYFAVGGETDELKTLAIRGGGRLYFTFLNQGPVAASRVAIDLNLLSEEYATAVVRETSQLKRDEPIDQIALNGKKIIIDVPAESMVQIIFLKEDLSKVTEIKLEEKTETPGTLADLKLLETTRIQAMGKLDNRWIDLTDLNIVWNTSSPELVKTYQGGLVQRLQSTSREVVLIAIPLAGPESVSSIIAPDQPVNASTPLILNGSFETPAADGETNVWACRYTQPIRWELQPSPAQSWVSASKGISALRTTEKNHTKNGNASIKLELTPGKKGSAELQAQRFKKAGIELPARQYKLGLWVYRPSSSGIPNGQLEVVCEFPPKPKSKIPVRPTPPISKEIEQIPTDKWIFLEGEITVPSDVANMAFSVSVNSEAIQGGSIFIDDVNLTPQFKLKDHVKMGKAETK